MFLCLKSSRKMASLLIMIILIILVDVVIGEEVIKLLQI